ncbi:MAG TPA: IPT/TIG domain-containing protein [Vicinamibacterales bacterium]
MTINGRNFSAASAVTFNGVNAASFTVTSDTAIQASVPATAATGPLGVTTPAGTATSAANFTTVPTITSFTPTSGAEGASVTISGANLTGATAVTFNGSVAAFTVASATTIQTAVPAGATTGTLSVTTPGGTATSPSNFTVAPTITSFTPASGPVGTTVTINGRNFTAATAVRFNGTAATFSVTSATAIAATVPAAATAGTISVTTAAGTATSTSSFAVTVLLTVNKANTLGIGDGLVTSTPPGINCGGTCSAFYALDSVVNLDVTTVLPNAFNGWTGCDSVSGTTCTVAMSRAKTVTANFLP